jgi:hypothetical protein
LDILRSNSQEVVLIGAAEDPVITDMKRELRRTFTPNIVLAGATGESSEGASSPLLEGREQINGKATVYICENYACMLTITTVAELIEQLG